MGGFATRITGSAFKFEFEYFVLNSRPLLNSEECHDLISLLRGEATVIIIHDKKMEKRQP